MGLIKPAYSVENIKTAEPLKKTEEIFLADKKGSPPLGAYTYLFILYTASSTKDGKLNVAVADGGGFQK